MMDRYGYSHASSSTVRTRQLLMGKATSLVAHDVPIILPCTYRRYLYLGVMVASR